MGRRRQGNTTPHKTNNNSIQDLAANEGNEFPVAHPSRMGMRMSNELNEELKEILQRRAQKGLKEKLTKELKEKLNIQKQLKEYQENTDNKLEKTQKQINEL
jgi:glycerol-3-phosphate dehydrogenase